MIRWLLRRNEQLNSISFDNIRSLIPYNSSQALVSAPAISIAFSVLFAAPFFICVCICGCAVPFVYCYVQSHNWSVIWFYCVCKFLFMCFFFSLALFICLFVCEWGRCHFVFLCSVYGMWCNVAKWETKATIHTSKYIELWIDSPPIQREQIILWHFTFTSLVPKMWVIGFICALTSLALLRIK